MSSAPSGSRSRACSRPPPSTSSTAPTPARRPQQSRRDHPDRRAAQQGHRARASNAASATIGRSPRAMPGRRPRSASGPPPAIRSANCEVPLVPRHSFSLWTRYNVSKQFGFGLGAIARSKSYASISNLVKLPGYARSTRQFSSRSATRSRPSSTSRIYSAPIISQAPTATTTSRRARRRRRSSRFGSTSRPPAALPGRGSS